MDEDTLRRILGEFASGIMERFDRVEREISGIYATIEKAEEKAGQRFDAIEKRLGNIEVQLEYVKTKFMEHDEAIFRLRRGLQG